MNDNQRRRQPQRDNVKDRPRDDGVHTIAERCDNVAKIKKGRDGREIPKQVTMKVKEGKNLHRPEVGSTRLGEARCGKKYSHQDMEIAQIVLL